MSRTYKKKPHWTCLRHPKHLNEESKLRQLLKDRLVEEKLVEEWEVSKVNRVRKRLVQLPDAWDDKVYSSYFDKHNSVEV